MDTYDKAIFDFLTQASNFDNMIKVMEHQEMIRRNLIIQFWDLVKIKLDDLNESEGTNWKVNIKEDYFEKWASLDIHKETWETKDGKSLFYVAWESLANSIHYGIWLDIGLKKTWNIEEIKRLLKEEAKEMGFSSDNHYWPIKNYYGDYNFENFKDLTHLLPPKRDALADEFARLVFELANKMEAKLDEMVIEHKI